MRTNEAERQKGLGRRRSTKLRRRIGLILAIAVVTVAPGG
jgi:hypothetical protein